MFQDVSKRLRFFIILQAADKLWYKMKLLASFRLLAEERKRTRTNKMLFLLIIYQDTRILFKKILSDSFFFRLEGRFLVKYD
jgi:hypothetical protein